MVGIKMRVGPKGQVVIPQDIREEFGIGPGCEVVFDQTDDTITIQKPKSRLADRFKTLAMQAKPGAKTDIVHGIYEQYEERWKRARKST